MGKVDILADHGDGDLVLGMLERLDQLFPYFELGRLGDDAELVADNFIEHLLMQHPGNPVDRVRVPDGDHGIGLNVGKQRDFFLFVLGDGPIGAAQERVGLDADPAQLLHRVLRGLGLDLAGALDIRHERQVNVAGVVRAELQAHLSHRFEEGQRLDVPDRAADLDDCHFRFAGAARDERLDLVGDMRDHLHSAAEVVAAALLFYHRIVDLAGGEVVVPVHPRRLETLVVAQIEVGLRAVLGDEHLPVLERAHRSRINVDVRVELEKGDFDTARFEDRGEGGGGYPLPQRGNHTARHEHILGHYKPGGWDGEWYTKSPSRSRPERALRLPQASSGRFLKCSSASGLASASTFFTGRPWTTLRTASSTILFDLVRGMSGTWSTFAGTCRGVVFSRIRPLIFATSAASSARPSRSLTNSTTRTSPISHGGQVLHMSSDSTTSSR